MTLDSEIANQYKKRNGTLGQSLVSSTLGHALLLYLAVDFSLSGAVSEYASRLINRNQQKASLIVSLHKGQELLLDQDSVLYQGPIERIGFSSKAYQGNDVQTLKPKAEIKNRRSLANPFQVEAATEPPKELEGIATYPKNFEGFEPDQHLQDTLTAEFNHALKPGERDEASYIKFFLAHLDHYRSAQEYGEIFIRDAIPVFRINSEVPVVGETVVRFFRNGTFKADFMPAPEFSDPTRKVSSLIQKVYDEMPKTFIPPAAAGLPSPTTYIVTNINPANPIAANVPRYVK